MVIRGVVNRYANMCDVVINSVIHSNNFCHLINGTKK